jgi:hypothetical protein
LIGFAVTIFLMLHRLDLQAAHDAEPVKTAVVQAEPFEEVALLGLEIGHSQSLAVIVIEPLEIRCWDAIARFVAGFDLL